MRLHGAEQSHRGAVGKDCTNTRFLKRVHSGIGMGRRVDDMAPVKKELLPRN